MRRKATRRLHTRTVQSYSLSGANVYPHLVNLNQYPHRTGAALCWVALSISTPNMSGHPGLAPFRSQDSPSRVGIWTPILHMVPWANLTPQPKWDVDRLSRFCTAYGRESLYFTMGRAPLSPGISPMNQRS